ncbi:uncharacterized protein LOC107413349 [Ziziphus jujuba]|uniref:Uncharacterized protein LOC107413349 n=1 Tax=Ziziphus jujuba TaxID=326968 RepID=A0A6P3ZTA2_ZIZJJ|nr:uncharacterized protein LOC107413349 [Ziziphus jujuba]XP_015876766.3 uncharacterized protein LOC107413349 [Ziziphus jujuba]
MEDIVEILMSNDREKINSIFSGVRVTVPQPQSKSDWTDDRLLNLKGIVLRRYNNPTQLATIVKEGLTSLQENVSHRTIGAIMVSAWNLYSVTDRKYVFPEIPINTTPDDVEFTALSQSPCVTNSNNPNGGAEIQWPVDDSVTCAVGAYVCACLLRLATKPACNLLRAWVNIKNRYSDLNKRHFEIQGLNPIQENLELVQMEFSNPSSFNNTLSRFVYHFNELRGNAKGLARFAFEQHLSLTGLHSYKLFRRVTDKLEANPDDLSVELNSSVTQRGLEMIDTILQKLEGSNDENQSRQT